MGLRLLSRHIFIIEAGTARVPLWARGERMLCVGSASRGVGFFDYSAGAPRDGVEINILAANLYMNVVSIIATNRQA